MRRIVATMPHTVMPHRSEYYGRGAGGLPACREGSASGKGLECPEP